MKTANMSRSWLGSEVLLLLSLAGMCVINGRLVAFLGGQVWESNWFLEFAFLGFSGPGSFTAAMNLSGSARRRLLVFIGVYGAIALSAVGMTLLAPLFEGLLPHNTPSLIGLYMLGTSLRLSEVPGLSRMGRYPGLEASMHVLLAYTLVEGLLHSFMGQVSWTIRFEVHKMAAVLAALGLGASLTLVGLSLGLLVPGSVSLRPLRCWAALGVLASAYRYLGFALPSNVALGSMSVEIPALFWTFAPGAIGLLWTLVAAGLMLCRARR